MYICATGIDFPSVSILFPTIHWSCSYHVMFCFIYTYQFVLHLHAVPTILVSLFQESVKVPELLNF